MELQTDKFLKTQKIREAEEAACRSRITKVPTGPPLLMIFSYC